MITLSMESLYLCISVLGLEQDIALLAGSGPGWESPLLARCCAKRSELDAELTWMKGQEKEKNEL